MSQQLHAALADPVLGIPAQLQPVLAHFGSAGSPRSVAGWLTAMPGGTLLAALAATAHHRELTHALLDEQPQTPALHHVRDMLVQAGVLPPRDEYLERIEPWLGEVLAGRPAHHAALVRPYATWHVLRRARRRSRGTSTMSAAGWARGRILAALAFLAWLDDRGATLGAATQADVDTWLHGATRYRYLLRDFLSWATARRLAGHVTVPAPPPSELSGLISEDSRRELLSRCLRDPGIPLDVRTAGALLLLYGQFVSRLTRLTAADIEQHGPDTCLRLDTVPVLLPPRLADLVRAQLDAAPAHSIGCPGPRPLFPGRSPARPVAPQTLTRRLREHGIEPRQARNTALAAWASDLPPAVLASLLGVHIQTAVNWASRTRRDWTAYLAERISSPGDARPPPGRSAYRLACGRRIRRRRTRRRPARRCHIDQRCRCRPAGRPSRRLDDPPYGLKGGFRRVVVVEEPESILPGAVADPVPEGKELVRSDLAGLMDGFHGGLQDAGLLRFVTGVAGGPAGLGDVDGRVLGDPGFAGDRAQGADEELRAPGDFVFRDRAEYVREHVQADEVEPGGEVRSQGVDHPGPERRIGNAGSVHADSDVRSEAVAFPEAGRHARGDRLEAAGEAAVQRGRHIELFAHLHLPASPRGDVPDRLPDEPGVPGWIG
jgi:hypothetical protein